MGWLAKLGAAVWGVARVLVTVTGWAIMNPVTSIAIGAAGLAVAAIWSNEPWATSVAGLGWYFLSAGVLGYVGRETYRVGREVYRVGRLLFALKWF